MARTLQFPMSAHVIGLCLACLTLAFIAGWRVCHRFEERISLPEIYAGALSSLYALGTLIPYLFYTERERMELFNGLEVEESDIAYAMLMVLSFSLILWCISEIRNPGCVSAVQLRHVLKQLTGRGVYFTATLSILAFQCALIATGKLGFQGLQHQEGDYHISAMASFCVPMGLMILLLSGFRFGLARGRWLIASLIAFQLSIVMIQGRRYFAIGLFFLAMGILLNRPSWRMLLGLTVVAIALLWVGVRLFTSMRDVKMTLGSEAKLSEVIREGIDGFISGKTSEGVVLNEVVKENLSERPVIIGFLAQLVSRRSESKGTWGEIFVNSLCASVPSKIFPEKVYWMLEGSEEDIAADLLGLIDMDDSANTILTTAYTEAREAGLAVYALIVLGLLALMAAAIARIRMPWLFLPAFVSVVFQLLFIEESFTSWFNTLRLVLLFVAVDIGCRIALKFHLPVEV